MYDGSENIRNLNDGRNLNPSVEDIKAEIEGRPLPPRYDEEQKQERIDEWNGKPETKENGIQAIDSDKEMPINKKKWRLIVFATVLGIIAMGIIALAVSAYSYTAWKDGTLLNKPVDVICGNMTVTVEAIECPVFECPVVQCSNVQCGDCNVPDSLELIIVNDTI